MNKKAQFAMLHPGLMFLIGLIIGAAAVYYLFTQGWLPIGGAPTS
tara:strand:+ start:1513 stop:1647 length:135 start_codon:yes stop_codon:yes gene_type:complete